MTRKGPKVWRLPACCLWGRRPRALSPWPLLQRCLLPAPMVQLSSGWWRCLLFLQEAGNLPPRAGQISSPGWTPQWIEMMGLRSRPMLVPLAAAWQGQEAPAVPAAEAMLYSRKGARAWWVETVPNMTTRRLAGLCMRWKGNIHFIIRIKHLSHFRQNKGIRLRLNNFHDKPSGRTKWGC